MTLWRMRMKVKVLSEPLLEFGKGTHICPRSGIERLGVYDNKDEFRKNQLILGIVGRGEGIDKLDIWLDKCRSGIAAKESKLANLFKGFGGVTESHGFHSKLLSSPTYTRPIQKSSLNKVSKIKAREERVHCAVDLYYDQIRFLTENRAVDVIVCVIPKDLFEYVTKLNSKDSEDNDQLDNYSEHNFRRLLKAKSMHLGVPLQLIIENTIDDVKVAKGQQDEATKAWNFCTALYYKGNRTVPWRLVEEKYKPRSCYVGIGFYKSRDGETISTSLAQVFDEFGHGVILRGTPVALDKNDRRPYMSEEQAYELLNNALSEYDKALMQMPARVVIHKSSQFRPCEVEGFNKALEEKVIRSRDYVSITTSDLRLFSENNYPPKRGTLLTVSESEGLLYTRGFVDFYKTYPGMYIPSPLRIIAYENDSSLEDLCEEILGLTKMNWNNTQLDGRLPITIECAKKVGEIMKYVDGNEKPQVSYSFYM